MPRRIVTKSTKRELLFTEAIRDAFDIALSRNPKVFLIGEGIPDAKGAFATTLGLEQKYGKHRVMDMPLSENAMTGVCIGAAIAGMRPILTHMRVDFSLLSMDQIINNAAQWYFMYGGQQSVPLVIRAVIGRGWGQGPQHSQSLHATFAHIPGLKVVMPASAGDAKGLMLAAVEDGNPVIFIEHRWLHGIRGNVASGYYTVPIGSAHTIRSGKDMTLVSLSYATIESLRALDLLDKAGVSVELIDLRTVKPLDAMAVLGSVKKTGRLLVVDCGWKSFGAAAEVIATVVESLGVLKSAPRRITLPDAPAPTSHALAGRYYPAIADIAIAAMDMLNVPKRVKNRIIAAHLISAHPPPDVPDSSFTGPF